MKVIPCFRQGRLALRANNKLSSVSGREVWHFVLISLVYPLFQAGKIWHYVLIIGYPLFQAGKVSITC